MAKAAKVDLLSNSDRNWATYIRQALLALGLVVVVSACSSDDTSSTAVDIKDFQAEGNQICSDLSAELQRIIDDSEAEAGSLTLEAIQQLNEARTASFDALFELQPPIGSEDDFARLQEIREEMVEANNARIPEPDAGLEFGLEWDGTAAQLGLGDCT